MNLTTNLPGLQDELLYFPDDMEDTDTNKEQHKGVAEEHAQSALDDLGP